MYATTDGWDEGGVHVFTSGRKAKTEVDAIVVCAGLGARTLGGVEDKDVFPVRGQVVMIRAPWIKFGRTASHAASGLWTYIIPRRSGDVSVPPFLISFASDTEGFIGHFRWHQGR